MTAYSKITAVLGPTNTGKTHMAITRMLGHESGIMGFPLRLLAREVYDRVVLEKGAHAVALVTGEEKIIPRHARYFLCTVESMPLERDFSFLAIDEIQLCADPDRGHIFTDRLLYARGRQETLFLGAETARPLIKALVDDVEFETRPRLSTLTYTGFQKLTRLPRRSAVVAFSVEDVYRAADLIRRQRGGTAIVLGALSPRTRNAQVAMYQAGEVDYLVATDAIGMGLNMDIHHVALAATRKFDGSRPRDVTAAELAQIAGRAGRHMRDGTFGITGSIPDLGEDTVEAIENHVFPPLEAAIWRNPDLDFRSPKQLLSSLERGSGNPLLVKGREADDLRTLIRLMEDEPIMAQAQNRDTVRLLWDVCQIPDFRKIMNETHEDMARRIFQDLCSERGVLDEDWMQSQLARIDHIEGDIDTLMARLSHIRTWTYITHRPHWLSHAAEWQAKTRAIEDRISDALHQSLQQRYVDQRATQFQRSLKDGVPMLAGIRKDGFVVIEGHDVGQLQGFRFIPNETTSRMDLKMVIRVARQALKTEIKRRLTLMENAALHQFKLEADGTIRWQPDPTNPLPGDPVARAVKGDDLMRPRIQVLESALTDSADEGRIQNAVQSWLQNYTATVLEPLVKLSDDIVTTEGEGEAATETRNPLPAAVRGIVFQLQESLGIVPRRDVEDLIAGLDADTRRVLRRRGVRLGPVLVFVQALNKPAAVRLRALLYGLWHDKTLPLPLPADGMVSKTVDPKDTDFLFYRAIGYPVYGPRAIRVDMLDRLITSIYDSAKDGKFEAKHQMAEWLGCPIADLYAVLEAMGHRKIEDPAEQAEESKVEQETAPIAAPTPEKAEAAPVPEGQMDLFTAPDPAAEKVEVEQVKAPAPQPEKPKLATFVLKKGKMQLARGNKPHAKASHKQAHPGSDKKDRPKFKKQKDKKSGFKNEPRVITAAAPEKTDDDSPFAILKQLKN